MKKKNLLGALLCTVALTTTAILPNTVMADAAKVVTLGADLSDAQKATMMKYFKVNKDEVQILYVTNADERQYLSNYISLAQIGTRTVSCAYVKPTTSGGIKVRTANLNYVTSNMIASTLSTSGVTNCEVVAACPFEVSGTGALTGIMMAYEHATGEELDPVKKDIATHEMVVTGNLAESIDNNKEAINIINSGKMEVVGNDIQNADEIQNVVVNIAQENNINISQEQLDEIVSLLEEIAKQDYDYEEMKETLENVEGNVTDAEDPTEDPADDDWEEYEEVKEDSILDDLDVSALGTDVLESSTEDPELEIETGMSADAEVTEEDEWDWEVLDGTENDTIQLEEENPADNEEIGYEEVEEEIPADEELIMEEEVIEEDELNLDLLTEEQKEKYEHLVTFCEGEFAGVVESLQKEMDSDAYPTVFLQPEVSEKLTKNVLTLYYNLLKDGTADYIPSELDEFFADELNILAKDLKETFNLEGYAEPGSYMEAVAEMDRQTLYDDTMKFFAKLYDEEMMDASDEMDEDVEAVSYDEESYEEEGEEIEG